MDTHLLQEVRRLGREAAEDTSGLVQEKALEAVGGEFILFLVPVDHRLWWRSWWRPCRDRATASRRWASP